MTLIQPNEVTPYIRGRVIAILNDRFTPTTLRIVSTGVGFESYLKSKGIDLKTGPVQVVATSLDPVQRKEATEYKLVTLTQYVNTGLDIYLADLSEQHADALFREPTSVPDGTGNSAPGVNETTDVCPFCKEVHD